MRMSIQCVVWLAVLVSCTTEAPPSRLIGRFQAGRDLFLAHFDCKTDVDDLHSIAGVATLLADPRCKGVKFHAVAGAYGIQEGLYVPANGLFEAAFGRNWSDAHADFDQALNEVSIIAAAVLKEGGKLWIAEAGQSDFSAALVRKISADLTGIDTKSRIHLVQHSDWNENQTAPDNLSAVKVNVSYHKIPDGNVVGNGSPGFTTDQSVNWRKFMTRPDLARIWETAIETANRYNGRDGRYVNPAIAKGGMDFSDVSETCWIFGFDHLIDAQQFFEEFSTQENPGQ